MKIYFVIPEKGKFAIYWLDLETKEEKRVNDYQKKEGALEIANHHNAKIIGSEIYKKYLLEML